MEAAVPLILGRYALHGAIASGGMATVHCGRLLGPAGFSRTVAIKRLHSQFAKDTEFVSMFFDEARMAARIRHPNVVPTLDVVAWDGELFMVMDFVHGVSLWELIRASTVHQQPVPRDIVSALVCGALHGLHAAHEATDDEGVALGIVHRDVSPQNVLVGSDGVPRVADFGVAKAAGRIHTTRDGQLKGKLAYMAPEQVRSEEVDRRTDIFAVGIMLWEMLTLRRLFAGDTEAAVVLNVLEREVVPPSTLADVPAGADAVVLRALERLSPRRFTTAREMALALESAIPVASTTRVSEWVNELVGDILQDRSRRVAAVESGPNAAAPPPKTGGEPSQVSSISVSSPSPRRDRKASRRTSLYVVGAGALTALLASAVTVRTRSVQAQAAPSAAQPSVDPTEPPPAPAPLTEPSPSPSSVARAATSASAPATAPVSRPRPGAQRAAPAPSAKPCTIKSYLDESGIKHFVKECK